MNFVEYIQNGTNLSGGKSTGWMINFGRYPTANTKIEIKFKHQNSTTDGNNFFGCHKYDGTNNYFRLFSYQNNTCTLDSPDDGHSRISVPVTFNQEVTLQATPAPNVSITNLNTQRTATATNGATLNYKFPMALWYGFDGDSGEVVEGTQIFYIKIWESNTLVMDLWPAVDNGVVGLYDKIGEQMYTNTGSQKVLTAGPTLSSVVVEASKKTLQSTGETIDIDVTCSNSWTVTQTGNWLTLSEASGTGNTTITATAPSYTGSEDRTTTLTFTDTSTSDTFDLTIKQRKLSNGQPFYLGANEVTYAYLGNSDVSEAYLGEVLVFSTSAPTPPPAGGITITIDGIDPCIVYDDGTGVCSDYDEVSYSIVQIDPSDDTELSVVGTVNLERTGDGTNDPYVWSIASSTLPQGVTASLDDSNGWDLLIEGSFNTANTYVVKCDVTTPEDYKERWGYANDDGGYKLNLSTDVTLTPDFSNELMPLRTLTIEGVPAVPSDARHIEVTDDNKFGIDITWDGSDVSTSVWTGDEGSGDRITVNYDDTEHTITIAADWEPYNGEGMGEYNIRMKAETDSCTVADGDEGTYSLQWQSNELTKTITFDGGTCTPNE